jgi:hypothetical protein
MPRREPFSERPVRKEIPMGTGYSRTGASLREIGLMWEQPISDPIQAIMEAAPHADIEEQMPPYGGMFEIAEQILDEEELAVLQMLYGGGLTQQETGDMLARANGRSKGYSKTWVRVLRDGALKKLRQHILEGGTYDQNEPA